MDDDELAATRDLEAMAHLGWGPDRWNDLGLREPGQLAEYVSLDREMRIYVLKVLGGDATELDHAWFSEQPNSQPVAEWMLGLREFEATDFDDEADREIDESWPSDG